jgi:hypothetical protein
LHVSALCIALCVRQWCMRSGDGRRTDDDPNTAADAIHGPLLDSLYVLIVNDRVWRQRAFTSSFLRRGISQFLV